MNFLVATCFALGLCLMGAEAESIKIQIIANVFGLIIFMWSIYKINQSSDTPKKDWNGIIYPRRSR